MRFAEQATGNTFTRHRYEACVVVFSEPYMTYGDGKTTTHNKVDVDA